MPRIAPLPMEALPDELRVAVERGLASRVLSTSLPVQIWAHQPDIALAWVSLLETLHLSGSLPARLRELVRLTIASITDCRACQIARKSDEVNEIDIACLSADDSRFSPQEQAALRYARLFADDYHAVDEAVFDQLRAHFSTGAIVELQMFCALMLAGGRMTYVQRGYAEGSDDQG